MVNSVLDRDVFILVCVRSDNSTLESLSRTSLWSSIRVFAGTQYFWYLRTCVLMSCNLNQRLGADWKSAYYALEDAKNKSKIFTKHTSSNLLTLNIILELGYIPNSLALLRAVEAQNFGAVRLILKTRSKRVDQKRIDRDSYTLGEAVMNNNVAIVSLLIEEGGINPNYIYSQPLEHAVDIGSYEMTRRLLQDGRVDPATNNGMAITIARNRGHKRILDLLQSDPRVRDYQGLDMREDELDLISF